MTEESVNSTTFTFMRTSAQFASPQISTLSIDSVSSGLNGTVVNCMDVYNPVSSTSTIQVIGISHNRYYPQLNVTSEEYEAGNVTVTVEWAQQVGVVYNVTVLPTVPIMFIGDSSCQLTISYNSEYSVSVEAIINSASCRFSVTAFIRLNYANCGHPELLPLTANGSVPNIVVYTLPVEGSSVTFSCPPGFTLIGSNSATCTDTGAWKPDLSGLMCKVTCEHPLLNQFVGSSFYILDYSEPAVVGTTVSFNCSEPGEVLIGPSMATCMEDGGWVPDPNQLSCKASCGTPETHSSVNYSSYNSTLEGATVTFRCTNVPFQDKEFTSICLKNTTWIPDPIRQCTSTMLRPAHCDPPPSPPTNGHIIPYTNTLEGAMVTYVCWSVHHEENISLCTEINTTAICNKNGNREPDSQDMCSVFSGKKSSEALNQERKIAVASSITVFAVTSILFFVDGFLSRQFICRNKEKVVDHEIVKKQTPVYDDVVLKGESERELELP